MQKKIDEEPKFAGLDWLSWNSTSPHIPESYHKSLADCKDLFRVVFRWLNLGEKHFDNAAVLEMHLLMCGLLHRDITLAIFDHDVDESEEPIQKPTFVRNSIFKLVNREGLEGVLTRVAAALPVSNPHSPLVPVAIPPVTPVATTSPDDSISVAHARKT